MENCKQRIIFEINELARTCGCFSMPVSLRILNLTTATIVATHNKSKRKLIPKQDMKSVAVLRGLAL